MMPSLFVPGIPLSHTQFNARVRDEIEGRRVPDSWGEYSDAATQSVSSSTNLAPQEVSTSLDASDEQWANGFTSAFTSRPQTPEAGLYLLVAQGNFAGASGDFAVSVRIQDEGGRVLGSGVFHGGRSTRNSFSVSTVAPLPASKEVYAMVGQASGGSLNLDEFGLWIVRLSSQALY